jgi:hypothetical protein
VRRAVSPGNVDQSHEIVQRVGNDRRQEAALNQEKEPQIEAHHPGQDGVGPGGKMDQAEQHARSQECRGLRQYPSQRDLRHTPKQHLFAYPSQSSQQSQLSGRAGGQKSPQLLDHERNQTMDRPAPRGEHPGEPEQQRHGCGEAQDQRRETGLELPYWGDAEPAAKRPGQEQQSGLAGERQA